MSTVSQLNAIADKISLACVTSSLILGVFGHIFNCILLTRRVFRNNPCVIYFLGATIANMIIIFLNNPSVLMNSFGNISLVNKSIYLCKILRYTFWMSRALSTWFIVCATIDRYLNSCSNVRIRSWSSAKNGKRFSILITIIFVIIYSHMLVFYDYYSVINSNGNVSAICNPQPGFYAVFSALAHLIIYSCIPILFMTCFGVLTLRNIRGRRRIIQPQSSTNEVRRRKIQLDNQLVRMLLIQILLITITTLPLSIQRLYDAITSNITKTSFRLSQEMFFQQMAQSVSYLAHSTNFYFFVLSGQSFRREFQRLIIKSFRYFYHLN